MSPENKYYPLTHPQKAQWYRHQFYPDTGICNIVASIRLWGDIDYDKLGQAINLFIKKNEGMRLRIVEVDGEPQQYVTDDFKREFKLIDFSDQGYDGVHHYAKSRVNEPFKIIDSDLFEFVLCKIGEQQGGFFIRIHHLISDAWTMTLMGSEVIGLYRLLVSGEPIPEEDWPSYLEFVQKYAEYDGSSKFLEARQYWLKVYSTLPELVTLKPEKQLAANTSALRREIVLSDEHSHIIRKSKTHGFILFLAAISIYLSRITEKKDIVIGTPILGRSTKKERATVGMFIDWLPLRLTVNEEQTFCEYLEYVRNTWREASRHRYPIDLLMQEIRDYHSTSTNLFDVILSYQKAKFAIEGNYETQWYFNGNQNESLFININDRENTRQLTFEIDYKDEIFDENEIDRLFGHLMTITVDGISHPKKNIYDLQILTKEEKYLILYDFNNTISDYPKDKVLHQIFEEQVAKTPDNIAVKFENQKLTYKELNTKANQLAFKLRKYGVMPNDIIGIMTYRSLEMVIGILGILKAGGAYLPIDPGLPNDRVRFMLEDSGTRFLLIQNLDIDRLNYEGDIIVLTDKNLYMTDDLNLNIVNKPTDLAYVIYTSGSTGKPKGTMIEHYSVINRLNWMQKMYPIGPGDTLLQKTPFTFDVSVWELFWWGFVGAKLSLLPPDGEKDPNVIIEAIQRDNVTTIHFVPSMLNIFLNQLEKAPDLLLDTQLRNVFASGEALTAIQVNRFNAVVENRCPARLYNLYGPTEATVDVSYYNCPKTGNVELVPIGKPIDNIRLYILDKWQKPVPIGSVGELHIAGDGLARGYLNRPQLTEEKFIPNPFMPATKMYRTGDLARWLPDGNIEYLGRTDYQVKIRGFRIELGEIEARLLELPSIKEAVVIDRTDQDGNKYLCAYLVADEELLVTDLRSQLLSDLPDYMVPAYFVKVDKMPLSPNGKLDRNLLPEPDGSIASGVEYVAPRNEIEEILVSIWECILKADNIGIKDNFFSLGGDSLKVLKVLTKTIPYRWKITAREFFKYPTIEQQSALIRGTNIQEISEGNHLDIVERKNRETIVDVHLTGQKTKPGNVLLTGATGFLGSHILDELIRQTNAKVFCLVRGENQSQAEERLLKILNIYFPNKYKKLFGNRVFVIKGDIRINKFGLKEDQYQSLCNVMDTVIHSAAIVKYYGHYELFEETNVKGTKEIMDFCLAGNIRFNHISTMGISGDYLVETDGIERDFTENDFYIGQNYMDNVYIRSKFEAENLVFKAMDNNLNATIFRMGLLTGRYSDVQFQINFDDNDFYAKIKAMVGIEAIPETLLVQPVEFSPIDSSSKAIVELIQIPEAVGKVFHINNPRVVPLSTVMEVFRGKGYKVRSMNEENFKEYIRELVNNEEKQASLMWLANEINIVGGTLNFKSSTTTKNEITQEYLRQIGFKWPEIGTDYISKVIDNMKEVGYLS